MCLFAAYRSSLSDILNVKVFLLFFSEEYSTEETLEGRKVLQIT